VNICTIIARNYVAHARVLAESFRATHPDGACSVLVIDDPAGFIDPAEEPFEILTIDQIGLPDPERMAASYDVLELSTAVKPWLLRHLLRRPGVDSILYLDPDIRVFSSLEEIAGRARRHDVVLTPHFNAPHPRDGRKPSEEDILLAGTYNLGFIALGAGKTADSLLDWWSERLETHCIVDPEQGHFVDQRWIDLAPGLWPGIDVLRDPAFNVAYWNLPTRRFETEGDGYRVDGRPLRFFHFSGFDPLRPRELSRHQDRIDVAADPALSRVCAEYAKELLDSGYEEAKDWPYGWDTMANGFKLDRAARRAHRRAVEAGAIDGSIFTRQGTKQFVGYLSETENADGVDGVVNRYVQALWDSRPDFRRAFPDIDDYYALPFVLWLHETAGDTGVSVGLLPDASPAANGRPSRRVRPEPGINLVGYLNSERGVGEAARQVLTTLRAGEVPTATIDTPAEPDRISLELEGLTNEDHPYDFNLICVNADMLPAVSAGLGEGFFENRHSAGLWFWEVSKFPEFWRGSFEHINEVWVASEHVAQALRPLSPVPVYTMRLAIAPDPPRKLSRAEMGMPDGFCFLFVFDYRSIFRRKNPLGVVEAFRDTFEPGSGPSLVIKSICGDEFPAEREKLAEAVRDRPDIHLIEETVAPEVKNAMIAGCDCYVSLHRSEGFGLTMAEAMHYGRPVIATAYSGNLDFMTEENSYLVPHTMVEIGPDADPYPADTKWAEPDLGRASALMRQVFEDPEAAAERGRRAAHGIRRTHSLQTSCESIEARVDEVRRNRLISRLQPPTGGRPPSTSRDRLEHLLSLSEPPPRRGAGRVRASAKRLYLRLLRPYASYQQRVNASTAESLDEIREILSEALRAEAATRRR
jgi:glycosyltransferase involved in cell wall biosynthesis